MRKIIFRLIVALPLLPLISSFPGNGEPDSFLGMGRANAQFLAGSATFLRADRLISSPVVLSAARAGQTEECKWLGVCD